MPWTKSQLRVGLVRGLCWFPIDEVTMYLEERCWHQVGVRVEDFVVPHSPPQVIDIKGETGREETSIEASVPWTGQRIIESGGPLSLVGPIEAQVSSIFIFSKHFFILLYFSFSKFLTIFDLFDFNRYSRHNLQRSWHLLPGEGGRGGFPLLSLT